MQEEKKIINILKQGGVGVLPTDTLYGLVGSALSKKAVERIYFLKKRARTKPFIILIGRTSDLKKFGIKIDHRTKQVFKKYWPGPISIVLPRDRDIPVPTPSLSLACRLPEPSRLRDLLKKTGPLVAPSANPEGEEPARTIEQARGYFKNKVDFYLDGGELAGLPSTLLKIEEGKIIVLRSGRAKLS